MLLRAVSVRGGSSEENGGFVYASLRDPRPRESLDAPIPVKLTEALPWGQECVLAGLIHFKARRGELRAKFRVDDVRESGGAVLPSKDEQLQRWAAALARPRRDVRAALAGPAPRLAIITGAGSVAVDDVRAQLRGAEADFTLQVVRVSMSDPLQVAKALREAAAGADAVALTRGGGQGVHDLDDDALIEAVATCPVPVVAALGHASDDLVVARVADASFPTPTALGSWLRETADLKRRHARQVQEAKLLAQSGSLLDRLRALERSLAWWRVAAVVLALLAAALAWLIVGRP